MGTVYTAPLNERMKTALIFVVLALVGAHVEGARRKFVLSLQCEDKSTPVCKPGNGALVCKCEDGSTPTLPPPCEDDSYPVCAGACKDGSDAVITADIFSNPPCADGSWPRSRDCACSDESATTVAMRSPSDASL